MEELLSAALRFMAFAGDWMLLLLNASDMALPLTLKARSTASLIGTSSHVEQAPDSYATLPDFIIEDIADMLILVNQFVVSPSA